VEEPVEKAEQRVEGRSPKDMALSLAVLIVPIALLIVLYRVLFNGDAPRTVDPGAAVQQAQQAKAFPVVTAHVGRDWHTTSARFTRQASGVTLRLGYVDPGKDPVQLVESSVPAASLLPAELSKDAKPVDRFRAANGVWQLYDTRPGEQALVLSDGSRTVIVIGKTGIERLEELAASLS
jgi:hypothetical protein